MRNLRTPVLLCLLLAGCGRGAGTPACGIAAIAGPLMILDQFSVPRQTLSAAPARMPEAVSVRLVAGPVLRGIVGRTDSLVIIGVDEALPPGSVPGFGVLITTPDGTVRGVVLFDGAPIDGAPVFGEVHTGTLTLPLIGLRVDPLRIEDARCPLFPPVGE